MAPIRFFTDEDVHGSVAGKLRDRGFDAVSTVEVQCLGETDEAQLEWAARENRALLTFNVSDFARLHVTWSRASRHHAGLIVSSQRPIGDLLRRVLSLALALSADDMRNRLEYLSNW